MDGFGQQVSCASLALFSLSPSAGRPQTLLQNGNRLKVGRVSHCVHGGSTFAHALLSWAWRKGPNCGSLAVVSEPTLASKHLAAGCTEYCRECSKFACLHPRTGLKFDLAESEALVQFSKLLLNSRFCYPRQQSSGASMGLRIPALLVSDPTTCGSSSHGPCWPGTLPGHET